jgi:hypothetical protein
VFPLSWVSWYNRAQKTETTGNYHPGRADWRWDPSFSERVSSDCTLERCRTRWMNAQYHILIPFFIVLLLRDPWAWVTKLLRSRASGTEPEPPSCWTLSFLLTYLRHPFVTRQYSWILALNYDNMPSLRVLCSADGWDAMLQAGRSRVRVPMRLLIFFNLSIPYLILT